MEIVGRFFCGQHRNVLRQAGVQRGQHAQRLYAAVGVKVHDLAFRMRSGVSAARAVDDDVLAGDRANRPFQLSFNGPTLRLLLPAGKARPVVLQHDFDIHFLSGRFSRRFR